MMRLSKKFNREREHAAGDLFAFMIVLPVLMFMLFLIINFGTYFEAKASIQQAAQSGARLVALYGGNDSNTALNKTGKSVARITRELIYKDGSCVYSGCNPSHAPIVTCSPDKVYNTDLGTPVTCKIDYWYTPVASADPYGFTAALTQKFTVTGSYISETGYQR